MEINIEDDGITHINVYSKGKTELGRLLSNFAHTPFLFKNKWVFSSVESAWYVYIIQQSKNQIIDENEFMSDLLNLSTLHGFNAKEFGKSLMDKYKCHNNEKPSVKVVKNLFLAKLDYNSYISDILIANTLPLTHYYVINGKYVDASKYNWMCDIWNTIKNELIT